MPTSDPEPLWIATLPGVEESIPALRRQAREKLAAYLEETDDLLVCLTEVATNAIRHTLSGDGGKFTVYFTVSNQEILISVADEGGTLTRAEIVENPEDTCGRGLRLVDGLAARWGSLRCRSGSIVWFAFTR